MSNPLDPGFASSPATVGASTSILDNFMRGWDLSETQTTTSVEDATLPLYENAIKAYEARIGKKTGVQADRRLVSNLIQPIIDPNNERGLASAWSNFDFTVYQSGVDTPEIRLERARQIDNEIKALNDPTIPSIEGILKQVQEQYLALQESAQQGSDSGGMLGWLAQSAGAGLGVLAEGDPLALSSMIGGGSGTIARRIGTDLLLGAAFGVENQVFNLNPTARVMGGEEVSATEAALQGALGQAIVGATLHGLGRVASRAYEAARLPEFNIDVGGDPQLRAMFEAAPESPRARAGLQLLDNEAQFVLHNPYGDTTPAYRRFTAEVGDVAALMEGRTDTAVGRFIASEPLEFNLDNWNADHEIVRAQQPLVFDRLVAATQRLNAVDTAIAEATTRIDNLSVADAVSRIDEAAGQLVRAFEEDMHAPGATNEVKLRAAQQIDKIVKSLGEDLVERNMNDAAIAPKKEMQTLQASRRAANKEFKAARNAMDRAIEANKALEAAKLKAFPQQPDVPLARVPIQPDRLRADVVARAVEETDATSAKIEADKEQTRLAPAIDEEAGTVVVGGATLHLDAIVPDFDNPGKDISVRDLMKRIDEDEALVEAVRTCAL